MFFPLAYRSLAAGEMTLTIATIDVHAGENGSPLFLDLSPLEAGLLDDEIIVATETRLRVEEVRKKPLECSRAASNIFFTQASVPFDVSHYRPHILLT
eukprot:scaffold244119_cov35-Tisochrysis_lutea.AAC.3